MGIGLCFSQLFSVHSVQMDFVYSKQRSVVIDPSPYFRENEP